MVVPGDFRSEPLGRHDRSDFSCGVDALDDYLRHRAGQDQKRKLAAPYVLVDVATGAIAGFYTLSSYSIGPAFLPGRLIRKLPKYGELPAILLGRLAVDRRYRGRGFGRRLVFDALYRCLVLSEQLGAFVVIVDAKDDSARAFYEHLGFLPCEDHPLRLYVPIASVAELQNASGPDPGAPAQ